MSAAPTKSGNEVKHPRFPRGPRLFASGNDDGHCGYPNVGVHCHAVFRTLIVHGREAVLREDLFTLRAQIDRFIHDYGRGPLLPGRTGGKAIHGLHPHRPLYRLQPILAG